MNRHLFTLPASHPDQILWLEELVTGPFLDEVVSDLKASGIKGGEGIRLTEILGLNSQSVLRAGLTCLGRRQVRQLLANPDSLVDLQEMVLTDGSDYWTALLVREKDTSVVVLPADSGDDGKLEINQSMRASGLLAGITGVIFALAASLILFFRLWQGGSGTGENLVDWGWAKAGALSQTSDRSDYLLTLAQLGEEWFDKTPATSGELSQRISDFQRGCTVILTARHDPLSEADRTWLMERCEAWKQKLKDAAHELQMGKPPHDVAISVDAIARNLVKALRERAGA